LHAANAYLSVLPTQLNVNRRQTNKRTACQNPQLLGSLCLVVGVVCSHRMMVCEDA
jgi:hypothetical protein